MVYRWQQLCLRWHLICGECGDHWGCNCMCKIPASGISAKKTELIALTKGLYLGQRKRLHTYTDSLCAFSTMHVHGAIYKEKRASHLRRKGGHGLVPHLLYSQL